MKHEGIEQLEELKVKLEEIIEEISDTIAGIAPLHIRAEAESYWLAHIKCAISDDHEYASASMATMSSTIDDLKKYVTEDEE